MREIKFRVWDKEYKEIYEVNEKIINRARKIFLDNENGIDDKRLAGISGEEIQYCKKHSSYFQDIVFKKVR